ncbi:MAG: hypothetical protein K2Q10_09380, partial [Rhodospirillales bacterium]|nr:hypothetical protein [Rhodospirillales bacterium]
VLRLFQPLVPDLGMAPWALALSLPLAPFHAAADELRPVLLAAEGASGTIVLLTLLVAGRRLVSRRLGDVVATLRRIGGPTLQPSTDMADADNVGRVEGVAYALAARLHAWTSETLAMLGGVTKVLDNGQHAVDKLTTGFDTRIRNTVEMFEATAGSARMVAATLPRIGAVAIGVDECTRRMLNEQPAIRDSAVTARAAAAEGTKALALAESANRISRLAEMLATKTDSLNMQISEEQRKATVASVIADMRKLANATQDLGQDVNAMATEVKTTTSAVAAEADRIEAALGAMAQHLRADNELLRGIAIQLDQQNAALEQILERAEGIAAGDEELRDEALALLVAGRQLADLFAQIKVAAQSLG